MDLLIHVGDLAYNMDDGEGARGDEFMQREQLVISSIPYMVAPGNHEQAQNFTHYRNRFHMPHNESGSPTPLYYSFDVGTVHFVALDVERYFFTEYYNMTHLAMQYAWAGARPAARHPAGQPNAAPVDHRLRAPAHVLHAHLRRLEMRATVRRMRRR